MAGARLPDDLLAHDAYGKDAPVAAMPGISVTHADLDDLATSTNVGAHEQLWRGGAHRQALPPMVATTSAMTVWTRCDEWARDFGSQCCVRASLRPCGGLVHLKLNVVRERDSEWCDWDA